MGLIIGIVVVGFIIYFALVGLASVVGTIGAVGYGIYKLSHPDIDRECSECGRIISVTYSERETKTSCSIEEDEQCFRRTRLKKQNLIDPFEKGIRWDEPMFKD